MPGKTTLISLKKETLATLRREKLRRQIAELPQYTIKDIVEEAVNSHLQKPD